MKSTSSKFFTSSFIASCFSTSMLLFFCLTSLQVRWMFKWWQITKASTPGMFEGGLTKAYVFLMRNLTSSRLNPHFNSCWSARFYRVRPLSSRLLPWGLIALLASLTMSRMELLSSLSGMEIFGGVDYVGPKAHHSSFWLWSTHVVIVLMILCLFSLRFVIKILVGV